MPFLVIFAAASLAVSGVVHEVPVDLAQREGVDVASTWSPWPEGDAFVGWNESCLERNPPEYIECSTVVAPPYLVRHSTVSLVSPADGSRLVAVFGGQEGRGGQAPGPQLSNRLYLYHVRLALWWMPFNGSESLQSADVPVPPARQSHAAFTSPKAWGLAEQQPSGDGPHTAMLVHGGFSESGVPLADVWRFHHNATWVAVPSATRTAPQLAGHSVVVRGGRAFFFGGYTAGGALTQDVWAYDIRNETFEALPTTGTAPPPRAYHTAVLLSSNWTSPASSIRDPRSGRTVFGSDWERSQEAAARFMVVHGGMAVVNGDTVSVSDFWVLDLDTLVWEEVVPQAGGYRRKATGGVEPAIPLQARQSHACVGALQRMVCYGGWVGTGGSYLDAFEYDLQLNRVLPMPFDTPLPAKLHHSAAVFVRNDDNDAATPGYLLLAIGGTVNGVHPAAPLHGAVHHPALCTQGTHSPDGDWMCFPCPAGDMATLYDCRICTAGSYASYGRSCEPCPAGTYAEANGTATAAGCTACPSGTQSPEGSTSVLMCEPCPVGTYSNQTGSTCAKCPAGTKGVALGSTSKWEGCAVCPYGSSSPEGASACTTCPAGTQSAPMVQRLWPYAMVISGWGTASTGCQFSCLTACEGERCTSCPRYICASSCGPSPASTYTVRAGTVLYVVVGTVDVGTIGTSSSAPTGMVTHPYGRDMLAESVTVEKQGGSGVLAASCWSAYPSVCSTVGEGQVGSVGGLTFSATPSAHSCRPTSNDNFLKLYFAVRLDTVTPLTTLVFRSGSMIPASLSLAVTGSQITVTEAPPAHVVAAGTFGMQLALTDAEGNVDSTSSDAVTLQAPMCYAVVGGAVSSTLLSSVSIYVNSGSGSASVQSSVVSFASGTVAFTLAVSGATLSDGLAAVGSKVRCTLRFALASATSISADAVFDVQQPHRVNLTHTGLASAGHPMKVHAEVLDSEGLVVEGDMETVLHLEVLRSVNVEDVNDTQLARAYKDANASLLPVHGSGLTATVVQGQADFFVMIDYPSSVYLKVRALSTSAGTVLYDTISITAGAVLATRLQLMDYRLSPLLQPFPDVVMGNATLRVGVQAVDADGSVDFTAAFLIGLNLSGCTGTTTSLRQINATTGQGVQSDTQPTGGLYGADDTEAMPSLSLSGGTGLVEFVLDGHDTDECKITFFHLPTPTDPVDVRWGNRTIAPCQAPPLSIRNPAYLDAEWDVPHCNQSSCTYCRTGLQRTKVKVFLRAQDGSPVTWINRAGQGDVRLVAVSMSLQAAPAVAGTVELENNIGDRGAASIVSNLDHTLGAAEFFFTPLGIANDTFQLAFAVGDAKTAVLRNVTYITEALGVFKTLIKRLGTEDIISPWPGIAPVTTCPLEAAPVATQLVVIDDPIVWLASGEVLVLHVEAQDDYGNRAHDISGILKASVVNCEAGYRSSIAFYLRRNASEMDPLSSASSRVPMGGGASTISISGILPAVHFEHDVAYKTMRGARGCKVVVEVDPPPPGYTSLAGAYAPFELVRLASACEPCPLGSWSPGGEGDLTAYWSGGCEPCPIGTFSAVPKASAVTDCLVCPSGSGYVSSNTWDSTAYKVVGEGVSACAVCPSGSSSAGSSTGGPCTTLSTDVPDKYMAGGQTGRVCPQAVCQGCQAGHYFMSCGNYAGSQATCDGAATQGYCQWSNGACSFVNRDHRPSQCLPCAAGTVQPSGNVYSSESVCAECAAGGFSGNTGHISRTVGRRLTQDSSYETFCTGTGTGNCPDGTYGPHAGMTSASECVPCPAGTWSTALSIYGTSLTIGVSMCFTCPPGTYSAAVGATSAATCKECPPGYYCPAGTAEPLAADRDSFLLHTGMLMRTAGGSLTTTQAAVLAASPSALLGTIPTAAYSLGGAEAPVYCDLLSGVSATHDASGWVKDGHFTESLWGATAPYVLGPTPTDHWGVANDAVPGVTISSSVYDHTQPATKLATVCYAVGGDITVSYHNTTNGWYFCCPSSCSTSNGGLGCGVDAACAATSSLKSTCCATDILESQKTCGVTSSAPCFLSAPPANTLSASLRVNATHDMVLQKVRLDVVNELPLYGRVWGLSSLSTLDPDVLNYTYGVRFHFYDNADQFAAHNASHTEEVVVERPLTSWGGWHIGEKVFTVPTDRGELGMLYGVGIEPFTSGGHLGAVYLDDISLRVDPQFACNCSLGFFFNRSRVGVPEHSTPCQRCPKGYMCTAGILRKCAPGEVTQGGAYRCGTCPTGWLCDYDGRGSSTPCLHGTYEDPDPDLDTCKTCPLGHSCRDGRLERCVPGLFGDGSLQCHLCLPGFFSNGDNSAKGHPANDTLPEITFVPSSAETNIRCTKCPAGHESAYMRKACLPCPLNKYSTDGDVCVSCPPYTFTSAVGAASCERCFSVDKFPDVVHTMSRNALMSTVTLLPLVCIDTAQRWRIVRHEETNTTTPGTLGGVSYRDPPEKGSLAVTFRPSSGTAGVAHFVFHIRRVNVKPRERKEQEVLVSFVLANSPPVATSDRVTIPHARSGAVTLRNLLLNDHDPDSDELYLSDDVYFADGATGAHRLSVADVSIDSTRRTMRVAVPSGFTGPMTKLMYRAIDKYLTATECAAASPNCLFSAYVAINITAKDAPPKATDDHFTAVAGTVTLLDVLANDVDADGDLMRITGVSDATTYNGHSSIPRIVTLCSQSGSTCTVATTPPQYGDLLCLYDIDTDRCIANATRTSDGAKVELSAMWVAYTPAPSFCGRDTFTYVVAANEDAPSTGVVVVDTVSCMCTGVQTPGGFDALFLLDSAVSHDTFQSLRFAAQTMMQRFDFSVYTGRVRTGAYQFGGSQASSGVGWGTVRELQSESFAAELELAQEQAYQVSSEGVHCESLQCLSGAPALSNAYDALLSGTAGERSVTLLIAHAFDDDPSLLEYWGQRYRAANITLSIVGTAGAYDDGAKASLLSPLRLKLYRTHQDLFDSSMPADHVSEICRDHQFT